MTPEKLKQTAKIFETVILSPGSDGNAPANNKVNMQDEADKMFTTAASVSASAC